MVPLTVRRLLLIIPSIISEVGICHFLVVNGHTGDQSMFIACAYMDASDMGRWSVRCPRTWTEEPPITCHCHTGNYSNDKPILLLTGSLRLHVECLLGVSHGPRPACRFSVIAYVIDSS